MAMNDEETAALIAGGHSFGKSHGAAPGTTSDPNPKDARSSARVCGWLNSHGTGNGADAVTSGLEGGVDQQPGAMGQRVLGQPVRLRAGS